MRHPLLDRTGRPGPFRRVAPLLAGVAAVATLPRCAETNPAPATDGALPSAHLLSPSAEALARIQSIRARIPGAQRALPPGDLRFEATADGHVRPVLPAPPHDRRAPKLATALLPSRASAPVRLSDDTSPLAVTFTLEGATEAALATADGIALYPAAAPGGGDILHRVDLAGTEDLLFFEHAPEAERVRYRVDVSAAAGLRLVSNTLELLDPSGTPRLRVAPPYLLDASGRRLAASLSVEGCAVDTSPAAPWGRPVTSPGAAFCTAEVDWSQAGARYPVLVDPTWQATENLMVSPRTRHTLTLLNPSGNKSLALVAGGFDAAQGTPLDTAELYDPLSRRFSPTGTMKARRGAHTATLLAKVIDPPNADRPVLIAGGKDANGPLDSLEVYDPASGKFFLDPNKMTGTPRFDHTATLFDDSTVLIAGGSSVPFDQPTNTGFVYTFSGFGAGNTPTSSLLATGTMASSRTLHAAARLSTGEVLLTGGFVQAGSALQTAEIFDKASSKFTLFQLPLPAISVMSAPRARHTATVLESGDILLTGGVSATMQGTFSSTADVFRFDPANNIRTFQPVSQVMNSPRADHTATLLTTGDVLIAGGFNDGTTALSDTEVFSPSTQAFTLLSPTLPMTARGGHAALLVNAGEAASGGRSVLVTGGTGGPNPGTAALPTAQILLRQAGDACSRGDECLTGFCADGVCCDTACDEECFACSKATKQTGEDGGVCGFAKQGADPRSQCINEIEVHTQCDGNGSTEQTSATKDCKPGTCAANGETCSQGCLSSNDCSATGWCDLSAPVGGVGQCRDKSIDSTQCTRNEQCESDHCVDGLCCDLPCEGQCQACDLPGFPGKCLFVGSPNEHADPHPNEGGVAPRSACNGLVNGQKTGCSGYCDGTDANKCTYPKYTEENKAVLKEPTCTDKDGEASILTDYRCAGDGSFTEDQSSCGGFRCADAHACREAPCADDAECIADHVCVPDSAGKNTCKELTGPLCDGKFTLRKPAAAGGNTPCPDHYTCPAGATQCRTDCDSVNDCVDDFVCNSAHKCVPQLTPPKVPSCSCRAVGEGEGEGEPSTTPSALALGAFALAAISRRRRRA